MNEILLLFVSCMSVATRLLFYCTFNVFICSLFKLPVAASRRSQLWYNSTQLSMAQYAASVKKNSHFCFLA